MDRSFYYSTATAPFMNAYSKQGIKVFERRLQVFRFQSRIFGDACQHLRANFLGVVKCER